MAERRSEWLLVEHLTTADVQDYLRKYGVKRRQIIGLTEPTAGGFTLIYEATAEQAGRHEREWTAEAEYVGPLERPGHAVSAIPGPRRAGSRVTYRGPMMWASVLREVDNVVARQAAREGREYARKTDQAILEEAKRAYAAGLEPTKVLAELIVEQRGQKRTGAA